MATNGINVTAEDLNVNFAFVPWSDTIIGYPYSLPQFRDYAIKLCGGLEVALKTAILFCDQPTITIPINKYDYANSAVLMVPNSTISNNDMTHLWKNKTIQRFYKGEGDATNSAGTSCIFTFDKVPEFQFTGIHLYDNPMSFASYPPDLTTNPPPAGRIGLGPNAGWSTFVVSGFDYSGTPPAYNNQISTTWLLDFFYKYARKGVIRDCKMTFTPNVNAVQVAGGGGGVTTLGALSDVTLGPLPVLHTTTRLSYVPTSSKWENVPVLQLHEWQYKLNYVTPPAEGTFLLNSNTLVLATELAIHKLSQSKYQDDNWLLGATDLSRKHLLQIQFNTYTYVYRINGLSTDNGTWRAYPIEYVDGWGNAILPDDIVAFSIIDDTPVYDATNIGSGLGVFEQKTGQTLEFKCIDTGIGLAASTSVGNEITLQLSAFLDDLNDVDLSTPPTLNQVLQYNGSDWVAATVSTGSLNNFTAVVDPTVTDDSSLGYSVGSQWLNTATNQLWFCADASVGTAVWRVSTNEYELTSVRTNATATIAAGVSNAVAIGNNATLVSGNQSIVIGVDSTVDGANSVGIGRLVDIQAGSCTAVGSYSICTTTHGTALGHQTSSVGNGHIALGAGATTTATEKLALGFNGNNNVAVGTQFARLPVSIDGTARKILMRDTDLALDDISDVVITTVKNGNAIIYNGTNYVNEPNAFYFYYPPPQVISGQFSPGAAYTTIFFSFTVPRTATYETVSVWAFNSVAGTAKIRCAIYEGNPQTHGPLLQETGQATTTTLFTYCDLTLGASVTLTAGTVYTFAMCWNNVQLGTVASGVNNAYYGKTAGAVDYYTGGFPANMNTIPFTTTSASRYHFKLS